MSSIFSTSAGGVGTHTTSLPPWPTVGSNGFCGVAVAWANASTPTSTTMRLASSVFFTGVSLTAELKLCPTYWAEL